MFSSLLITKHFSSISKFRVSFYFYLFTRIEFNMIVIVLTAAKRQTFPIQTTGKLGWGIYALNSE